MAVFFHITVWISVAALDLFWMLWPRHTGQVCMEQHFLTSGLICLWECKLLVLSAPLLLVFWFYSSFHAVHNPIVVALPLMVLSSDFFFLEKNASNKIPNTATFWKKLESSLGFKGTNKNKIRKQTYLKVPKNLPSLLGNFLWIFFLAPQFLSYALWFYTLPQPTLLNILQRKTCSLVSFKSY